MRTTVMRGLFLLALSCVVLYFAGAESIEIGRYGFFEQWALCAAGVVAMFGIGVGLIWSTDEITSLEN